jgi:predicted NBD/HSP70 family sugar kinase
MRRSAAGIREALGSMVLELRRRAASSRSSLAQALGIAPSTGGLYVDLLIDAGYITEAGLDQGAIGRPRRSLALRPDAGWFAGVEFHAARIQAVRVDFAGKVIANEVQPIGASENATEVMARVAGIIAHLSEKTPGRLLGIGIGAPGIVDPEAGIARDYRFILGWRDVPVVQTLSARFGVPVALEHNLRTIALGERWFGGGLALESFVCLGLRTGVGVGVVLDGHLLRGSHFAAGEVGLWPWPLGSTGPGDLQTALSAPAIYRRVTGLPPAAPVPGDLRVAFTQLAATFAGGIGSTDAWRAVIQDLGQFIAALHLLLDPEAFFLHGPLTALDGPFCEAIAAAAGSFEGNLHRTPVCVLPSQLGEDAGALGAAGLAMERWEPAIREPMLVSDSPVRAE